MTVWAILPATNCGRVDNRKLELGRGRQAGTFEASLDRRASRTALRIPATYDRAYPKVGLDKTLLPAAYRYRHVIRLCRAGARPTYE